MANSSNVRLHFIFRCPILFLSSRDLIIYLEDESIDYFNSVVYKVEHIMSKNKGSGNIHKEILPHRQQHEYYIYYNHNLSLKKLFLLLFV